MILAITMVTITALVIGTWDAADQPTGSALPAVTDA
jgi:hypothetical protein